MTLTDAPLLPDPDYLTRRSLAERVADGRSVRRKAPLERHARWATTAKRSDPIAILDRQAAQRIPELVPIRYGRMAVSAFAFYRGAAAIMAADLSDTAHCGLRAQLCGDAHLLNFGMFETPERSLTFGLNDFDETLPGPIEWDVKRLAASIEIAARDLGFGAVARERVVRATVRAYREAMLDFAEQSNAAVWFARLPAESLHARLEGFADRKSSREAKKRIRQALRRDHLHAFDRLVEHDDKTIRFVHRPPLIVPIEELLDSEQRERYHEVIRSFLHQYRESLSPARRTLIESYRYVHIARKVVGVGSVGTRAWIVLFTGRDEHDPLILQLKEAEASVLAPYAGDTAYESQGRRVVEGQQLMQAASDPMLGWYHLQAWDGDYHSFYVRQLWDGKASIDVAQLSPKGLRVYGESCGWTLARGHARSGDRVAMAAYLGEQDTFDRAVTEFAAAYADTNGADHQRLLEAIDDGTINAIQDV
ncbi:MAG: DUF2252 domain-containing protein [Solirubrobacteraceae bacterium]